MRKEVRPKSLAHRVRCGQCWTSWSEGRSHVSGLFSSVLCRSPLLSCWPRRRRPPAGPREPTRTHTCELPCPCWMPTRMYSVMRGAKLTCLAPTAPVPLLPVLCAASQPHEASTPPPTGSLRATSRTTSTGVRTKEIAPCTTSLAQKNDPPGAYLVAMLGHNTAVSVPR